MRKPTTSSRGCIAAPAPGKKGCSWPFEGGGLIRDEPTSSRVWMAQQRRLRFRD